MHTCGNLRVLSASYKFWMNNENILVPICWSRLQRIDNQTCLWSFRSKPNAHLNQMVGDFNSGCGACHSYELSFAIKVGKNSSTKLANDNHWNYFKFSVTSFQVNFLFSDDLVRKNAINWMKCYSKVVYCHIRFRFTSIRCVCTVCVSQKSNAFFFAITFLCCHSSFLPNHITNTVDISWSVHLMTMQFSMCWHFSCKAFVNAQWKLNNFQMDWTCFSATTTTTTKAHLFYA